MMRQKWSMETEKNKREAGREGSLARFATRAFSRAEFRCVRSGVEREGACTPITQCRDIQRREHRSPPRVCD